jgi:hypothetical protein
MMNMKVGPSESASFPFTLSDVELFDLQYYRGSQGSSDLRAYARQIEARNEIDPTIDHIGDIPESAFLPSMFTKGYRGLPIPRQVEVNLQNGPACRTLSIASQQLMSTPWVVATNDRLNPSLIIAWPTAPDQNASQIVSESSLKVLQLHAGKRIDLRIDRLFVWHELTIHIKQTGKLGIVFFYLHAPKAWLVPTPVEQLIVEQVANNDDGPRVKAPGKSPFALLYSNDGVLVYLKHFYHKANRVTHLPPFLSEPKGCHWVNYKKTLKSFTVPTTLSSGHNLPPTNAVKFKDK